MRQLYGFYSCACCSFVLLSLTAGLSGCASDAGSNNLAVDVQGPGYRGQTFDDNVLILTDPMLTGPSLDGVVVVWYSELAGAEHEVFYGDGLDRRVAAETTVMSQLFEDAESRLPDARAVTLPAGEKIAKRRVFRHVARVTGLEADRRVPYYAVSRTADAEFRSRVFTLQPLPSPDQPVKLLLTSDTQNHAMAPANFEKVVQTVGQVDAVLFAGDFVDTPNRASEWFDQDDKTRPPFFPSMQGRTQHLFPQHPFRGGEILQHAPLFATIGNHESVGRFDPTLSLKSQDNDPRPRWFATWQWDQLDETQQSATGLTRDAFIRARSFNHSTYYDMWDLPENAVAGEDPEAYYALRYGNVALVSMNVSRVWRNWDDGFSNDERGKFAEPADSVNELDTWGFGDMFFADYSPGSAQRGWLGEQLASEAFGDARFRIVLAHQTMFGHGDNAVPVMAAPEATITFQDQREPIETRFPSDDDTWASIVKAADDGVIDAVRYRYPREMDLWLGVEKELLAAGVELVHAGHSHIWNRTYVDREDGTHRLHYLETSNVGNSFGPTARANPRAGWAELFYPDRASNKTRDKLLWPPEDYPRFGDPHGRVDVPPSRSAQGIDVMHEEGGRRNLPFISSNQITVFSILDSADGTVRSYAYDTRQPSAPAVEVDCFGLEANSQQDPCALVSAE